MDDLDGLLELADEFCGANTTHTVGLNSLGTYKSTDEQCEDDGGDLLLCLADSLAEDDSKRPAGVPGTQPRSRNQQESIPTVPASVKSTATAGAPAAGSRRSAVSMTAIPAFSVVGKGSSSNRPETSQKTTAIMSSSSNSSFAAISTGSKAARAGGSVQQQQQGKQQQPECQHYIEKLTGLKIKLPRMSGIVLKERYKHITYVPVSNARSHDPAASTGWVVVGVLISKNIGTTGQGAPYSRWRISDLAGSDIWVSLFGDAHQDHYAQAEGSVLAFYTPRFSSKGPGGAASSNSSSGLAVAQSHQVEHVATSAGWGFCRGLTKAGSRCSSAVDITVSHYCQYHALQQAKTLKGPVKVAGRQQGAAAGGAPAAPAPSNGKVFDAQKHAWSKTVTANSSSKQQQQQQQPPPTIKGSFSSRQGNSSSGVGSTAAAGSGCGLGVVGTKRMLLGDAAAAAAAHDVAARCAAEAARRKAAEQAEVKEALRRRLLQQQRRRRSSSQEQQPPHLSPAGSQDAPSQQQPGSSGVVFSLPGSVNAPVNRSAQGSSRAPVQATAAAAGFSLNAVVAAVEADKQRQQREQHSQWLQPAHQQQPLEIAAPAAAAAAVGGEGGNVNTSDIDAELEELFGDGSDAGDDLHIMHDDNRKEEAAAAAAAAVAAGDSGSSAAAAAAAISRLKGIAGSGSSRSNVAISGSSKAQQRLKADLGLGPRVQRSGNKGSGLGSKAAALARGSSSSKSNGQQQHVSRIGAIGATGGHKQQQQLGGSKASTAAAAGGGGGGGGGGGKPAGGGGVVLDFKATFGRVLQRADINKPDAKLLAAAAAEAHGAMFAKLLDQYEQKDRLAQQLEGITKLQVTAFECRTCKTLTEKRHASCSSHDVISVRVMKRWWLCEACGWKVTTLREVMPTKRCPKCRDPGVLFKPTSAYNAPKPMLVNAAALANPIASRGAMLPRGMEHGFCLQDSL